MTHYNLDRMQFTPPDDFLPEETPQGAEWWEANRGTAEAAIILDFLRDSHAQLVILNAQHKAAA